MRADLDTLNSTTVRQAVEFITANRESQRQGRFKSMEMKCYKWVGARIENMTKDKDIENMSNKDTENKIYTLTGCMGVFNSWKTSKGLSSNAALPQKRAEVGTGWGKAHLTIITLNEYNSEGADIGWMTQGEQLEGLLGRSHNRTTPMSVAAPVCTVLFEKVFAKTRGCIAELSCPTDPKFIVVESYAGTMERLANTTDGIQGRQQTRGFLGKA